MSARVAHALTPPGWDLNPSAWRHRAGVLALVGVGLLVSVYLTLCQLGILPLVDPFFGGQAERVIHSPLSRALPVPDAALGAIAYACELALEGLGGEDRWRRHPWWVVGFGVLALGMATAGLGLTIMQGAVLQAWCAPCLLSAAVSVGVVGPALTEVLAALQHLKARREGRP